MDAPTLRDAFPLLAGTAYLNAGTCGPLPQAAADAGAAALENELREGRSGAYYMRLYARGWQLRERYAALLGAATADVALTAGSSDGIARVIGGLELAPGDEVVTADDEHPGLYGPLIDVRDRRGVTVTAVPLADVPAAVGPRTRLVACSHVAWCSGRHAPVAELREACGERVPLLLDGAQSAGAVAIDIGALGASFYAGSGQKWLCGAVGTGMLWVAPEWAERLATPALHYGSMDGQARGLDAAPATGAVRFDAPSLDLLSIELSLAAFDVLERFGWERVFARAAAGAERLAAALTALGSEVVDRDPGPLVAWSVTDDATAAALRDRCEAAGVVIRDLPGRGRMRASVGAWNDDGDIDHLLAVLTG